MIKIGTLHRKILKLFCCKRKLESRWFTNRELLYLRGHDLSREDMNLFRLLQTIHKLKASVQVLIGDNAERLQKVKQVYLQHADINQDPNALRKNEVRDFLERDEKKLLYDY